MATFIVDLYTFSPNGLYLASLNHTEKQILIRKCDAYNDQHSCVSGIDNEVNRFKVEVKFILNDQLKNGKAAAASCPVDTLMWSPDSCFLAACCKKYAVISVFSVLDFNWKCRVKLGEVVHGLESFMWGRDARHLICVSADMSFLSVWSIRSKQVQFIKDICPIPLCAGICYNPDDSLLATAHISSTCSTTQPYYIGIYSITSSSWHLSFKFSVICKDLAGISWCPAPSSEYICLWDSNLFSNLYVYNTKTGSLVKQYSPYGMTSSGFSSVQWSSSGDFLVCTTQNKNELHVLNGLTFGVLIHDVLEPERSQGHFSVNAQAMGHCDIFYESNKTPSLGMNKYQRIDKWPHISMDSESILSLQVHLKSPRSTTRIKLSPNETLLACTTRFYSQVLWIYDLGTLATPIAVLIHQHPVVDFDWSPSSEKVVIICNTPTSARALLYFWTTSPPSSSSSEKTNSSVAYIHNTTAKIAFSRVKWSPQGNVLLVRDISHKIHLLSNL